MNSFLEQAVAAHRSNNLADAERLYLMALTEQPRLADARFNLGMVYGQQNRAADALRELSVAVDIKPDFGEAWFMLCEFADQTGDQHLNLKAGEQAVQLLPDTPRAWLRYGLALSRLERDEEAIKAYRRAVELDPGLIKAWVNLCFSSKAAGQPQEALTAIRKAIEVSNQTTGCDENAEEQYSFLHYHLALLELALDDYPQGFAHFRARFKGGTDWTRFESAKPAWRGEDLNGKTILVMAEQGHGDTLMMARYLPLLKEMGARVTFQTHPALVGLFAGWNGVDDVVPLSFPITDGFDYHTSIFDLPCRFDTDIYSIPGTQAYLPLPPMDEEISLDYIAQKSATVFLPTHSQNQNRAKVGVVWAGQLAHQQDKKRSIPLAEFADLFDQRDVAFFNLTRDMRPGEAEMLLRQPVINLASMIGTFADSAYLINQLDLLITCDTAAAHLAGGMGKPVWLLLPYAPDWRWGYGRDTSPWYPSMRLFRQHRRGDWSDVIAEVKDELRIAFYVPDMLQVAGGAL